MAKHEVTIHENTGATKTDAPYLPTYVKKSDLDFSALCKLVADEAGLTETQARAILEGAFNEFKAMEQEAATRLHVDGLTVHLALYGSFASADAAFDPLKNTLEIALVLDDDVKYVLADVTPTIATDETSTKVRITLVADEAEPRPYEVIHGQHVYTIQGYNLVTTDVGASIYLENALGATFPCTIVEAVSKQLVRVRTSALLPAGDYKQVVKSRGGDSEGPTQTVFRKVKYLYIANPPQINSASQPDRPMNQIWANANAPFEIFGNYLALGTTDQVIVEALDGDGGTADSINVTSAVTSSADTRIAVSGIDMSKASDPALWVMHGGRIVIVRAGSRYEHSIQLVAES